MDERWYYISVLYIDRDPEREQRCCSDQVVPISTNLCQHRWHNRRLAEIEFEDLDEYICGHSIHFAGCLYSDLAGSSGADGPGQATLTGHLPNLRLP